MMVGIVAPFRRDFDAARDPVAAADALLVQSWATYTPVLSSSAGTFTSATVDSGRFKRIGTTIFYKARVLITTNGTASGYVKLTLPVNSTATQFLQHAMNQTTFSVLTGVILGAVENNIVRIYSATGTYPGADSTTLLVAGTYEAAYPA